MQKPKISWDEHQKLLKSYERRGRMLRKIRAKHEALKAELSVAQEKHEDTCTLMRDKLDEFHKLQSKANGLETQVLELNCSVQSREQLIEDLQAQCYNLTQEHEELKSKHKDLKQEHRVKHAHMAEDHDDLLRAYNALSVTYNALLSSEEPLSDSERVEFNTQKEQIADLTRDTKDRDDYIKDLRSQRYNLELEVRSEKQNSIALEDKINALEATIAKLKKERDNLNVNLTRANQLWDERGERISRLNEHIENIEKKLFESNKISQQKISEEREEKKKWKMLLAHEILESK